jgi:hypothetical protein
VEEVVEEEVVEEEVVEMVVEVVVVVVVEEVVMEMVVEGVVVQVVVVSLVHSIKHDSLQQSLSYTNCRIQLRFRQETVRPFMISTDTLPDQITSANYLVSVSDFFTTLLQYPPIYLPGPELVCSSLWVIGSALGCNLLLKT